VAVTVLFRRFGSSVGYDIVVNEKRASVQDYLNALNRAFRRENLSRTRRFKGRDCFGCDRCCGERVPLTVIDGLQLRSATHCRTWEDFWERYTIVTVAGPVVDIVLRTLSDGYCIFLDRKTRTCKVYPVRPFVCQTFMCCPATPRASVGRSWERSASLTLCPGTGSAAKDAISCAC